MALSKKKKIQRAAKCEEAIQRVTQKLTNLRQDLADLESRRDKLLEEDPNNTKDDSSYQQQTRTQAGGSGSDPNHPIEGTSKGTRKRGSNVSQPEFVKAEQPCESCNTRKVDCLAKIGSQRCAECIRRHKVCSFASKTPQKRTASKRELEERVADSGAASSTETDSQPEPTDKPNRNGPASRDAQANLIQKLIERIERQEEENVELNYRLDLMEAFQERTSKQSLAAKRRRLD